MTEWLIAVVDANPKAWPAAEKLLKVGVPLKMVTRYKIVRRAFTSGLKRRLRGELRN